MASGAVNQKQEHYAMLYKNKSLLFVIKTLYPENLLTLIKKHIMTSTEIKQTEKQLRQVELLIHDLEDKYKKPLEIPGDIGVMLNVIRQKLNCYLLPKGPFY